MKPRIFLLAVLCFSFRVLAADAEQPLRVFIRASAKTHGPGEHDYPRFLEEWTRLLQERGAAVEGAQRFPTEEELKRTDVLIIYAADGANIVGDERARFESHLRRGGGVVTLHDGICGTNATWFASATGGAKQHGEMNWKRGPLKLKFKDPAHPILQGMAEFEMNDEMFFLLRLAPDTHVLATAQRTEAEAVPQLWVYEKSLPEGRPYRSFVSLQGHYHTGFSQPEYRKLILRGIAWAGRRPVDLLAGEESGVRIQNSEGRSVR